VSFFNFTIRSSFADPSQRGDRVDRIQLLYLSRFNVSAANLIEPRLGEFGIVANVTKKLLLQRPGCAPVS